MIQKRILNLITQNYIIKDDLNDEDISLLTNENVSYNFTWYGNQIDLYYLDSMGVLTHPVKISRYFRSEYGDLFCEKVVQKKIDLLV